MEFLKLYDKAHEDVLYSMSWLHKNSFFDKSIGAFQDTDLFTFLENVNEFDCSKDLTYDDIHYILEYSRDSILRIINNINKAIKREHRIVPIAQAKEFDKKCIIWLSRQDGRTIKEKLKNNKIKTVKRYSSVDTYENRIFKILLKKIVLIDDVRKEFIGSDDHLVNKIKQWLRSEDAKNINEYGNLIFNNLLLHHPYYSKIYKSYKWLKKLEEKVNTYIKNYPDQISSILYFTVLSKLQFKTNIPISPKTLKVDYDNFQLEYDNDLLSNDKRLSSAIKKSIAQRSKVLAYRLFGEIHLFKLVLKDVDFYAEAIIGELKIEVNQNRKIVIDNRVADTAFIDLFSLFPVIRIHNKTTQLPISLKQKIGGNIVNACNTKIIDLNNEIFTLPQLLKTYDTDVLKVFMYDLLKHINTKQLNYIIPDYVNIFEFSKIKKSINSFFPNNRNIPKSVLIGLEFIFQKKIRKYDTLISIQKDHNNDLYVTPLLVKYDKDLKNITNGLYLEKHPTKKLENDKGILNELNKTFDEEIYSKLLSVFLENGIKGVKQKNIVFYYNDKHIRLTDSIKKISNKQNRIKEVKNLFNNKNLFKSKIIDVQEKTRNNLRDFEKLLAYEKQGYTLWKEHLPRLAMQLPINGYMGEFVLVDDSSEVIDNNIKIKNPFIIPKNTKELSFPLILGDANINFEAYVSSNDLPVKKDLECRLKLTYNYEAETPYELTFVSLDNPIKTLKVKWREIKEKEIEIDNLPVPDFPVRKNWSDFTKYPKEDGKRFSDLLEWCSSSLNKLNELDSTVFEGKLKYVRFDKNKDFFCRVVVGRRIIFCTQSSFIKEEKIDFRNLKIGDTIYLSIEEGRKKGGGIDISFKSKINSRNSKIKSMKNEIFNARFPVLTIWNNGHSLSEPGVPDNFRNAISDGVQNIIKILKSKNIPNSLKEELFFFLCCLHKDAPEYVSNRLNKEIKNKRLFYRHIAFAIGCAESPWQRLLLTDVLKLNDIKDLEILSIALWRSEELIDKLQSTEIENINNKLCDNLKIDLDELKKVKGNIKKESSLRLTRNLELLLAILRTRGLNDKKIKEILSPNKEITKKYVKVIDGVTKIVVEKKIKLKSRIELKIDKPESFDKTPDLLYVLRVYLTGNTDSANSIKVLGVKDD